MNNKEIKQELINIRNGALITPVLFKIQEEIKKSRQDTLKEVREELGHIQTQIGKVGIWGCKDVIVLLEMFKEHIK